MTLKEANLKKNSAGAIQWPKFKPGDCYKVERNLVRRFVSIVTARGLRNYMMAENEKYVQYRILTPQEKETYVEHILDWRANPITEENVPRNPLGHVRWKCIIDDNPPQLVRIESSLTQRFGAQCGKFGYHARRIGVDDDGMILVRMLRHGEVEPISAKQYVKRDLASLPPKWIIAIHDSVCAKAKLTPLTEEQRAELMETW
jgi:hypothetical protein